MDSRQSRPIDEKARVQFKYQGLLQDYLDLQKVSLFSLIKKISMGCYVFYTDHWV